MRRKKVLIHKCKIWKNDCILSYYKTLWILVFHSHLNYHRDILIEATSSQKVRAAKVSSGDQGGEPTLGHWPQCYRV
jgi:hypothetical protein